MAINIGLIVLTLVLCFVAVVIRQLIPLFIRRRRNEQCLSKFPQDERHWLWGSLRVLRYHMFNRTYVDEYLTPDIEKFKYCHVIWIGPFHGVLVVYHPDVAKAVLKRSDGKGRVYALAKEWLGEGLITSSGARWFRDRRLLTSAFHFDVLKSYVKTFNNCSQTFLDKIANYSSRGESMDAFDHVSQVTLDTLFHCAFSLKTDCQTSLSGGHPYLVAVRHLNELFIKRILLHRNPLLMLFPGLAVLWKKTRDFYRYCKISHEQANTIIETRRKELENNNAALSGKKCLDFIDIMLSARDESGEGLSNEEIRDEVDTFLFAGHDTTASAITWTLYCLATNPEIQDKVKEELDVVLKGRDSGDITWDDIPKLTYLSQCFKESIRMYSTVPFIQRELEDDVEVHGHKLLAGTTISLNLYALHNNPHVWPEPNKFNPDRFSPENSLNRDPHAYIPFSAGPRNCLGKNFAQLETKVIIGRVVQKYRILLESPLEERPINMTAVMKSSPRIMLKFTPRDT